MNKTKEQVKDCALYVFKLLEKYMLSTGRAPTTYELMRICNTTQQTARNYLKRLSEMGYVRIEKGRMRGITIVPPEERKQMEEEKRHRSVYPAAVVQKEKKQLITHVKVGDTIKETRKEKEKEWMFVEREKEYRVMEVYPYHVLTVENGTSVLRSFSYGDLIVMGLEYQAPELEARRIKTQDARH